jgi:uncharacterized membrane protein YdjX (TVP38/TMEM64 family)
MLTINKFKALLFIFGYFVLVVIIWHFLSSYVIDKETLRNFINGYGIFGPVVFILVTATIIVFVPISNYPVFMASGLIFGPWLGFFLNWVSIIVSTAVILLITKKFGRPLVNRLVSKKTLKRYDGFAEKYGAFGLFVACVLPLFPDDELTYFAGLSSLTNRKILLAVIFGRIPAAAFSFIGNEVINGAIISVIIRLAVLIVGAAIYFRKSIFLFFQKPK